MGKHDIAVRNLMKSRERFADLYNGGLFEGEQVIKPEELEPVDGESGGVLLDKDGKEKIVHRYRDVVMLWKKQVRLGILAIENQDKIHYAMPIRNMLYDSLSYLEQMKIIWESRPRENTKITGDEFLSRFRKDDRLYPVITLVFYYGEDVWDASVDLHSMLQQAIGEEERILLEKYVPNYHINLIDAERMQTYEMFQTDLHMLLEMLQYRSDKKKLLSYVNEHKDYFGNMNSYTYQAANAFLNAGSFLEKNLPEKKEDKIDMCKALNDLYQDGIAEGKAAGIAEEKEQMVRKMLKKNLELEMISDIAGISVEEICEIQKA